MLLLFSSPGTAPLRCLCAPAPAGLRSTQQFFPVFQGRGAFTDSLDGAGLAASPALHDLFDRAEVGVAFGMKTIMRVYDRLNELVNMEPGFYSVMKFFELMYELSISSDYKLLSSSAFAHVSMTTDSRRVQKVKEYIDSHYREEIRLQTLANLVSMTSTAFSRFFKLRTNKSISEYIIDIRLGHAARLLADSTMAVVEICYHCGFNNISNFNRIFKKRKGCTPTEFRENYHKKHVIV